MSDCVFCRIVDGKEPAKELWRGWRAMVIAPLNPVVPGHALAIPFEHVKDFTDNKTMPVFEALHAAVEYARPFGGDFNLITSKGPAATQSVFHLHWHIVPRAVDDGLTLPWTRNVTEVTPYPDPPNPNPSR